MEEDHSPGGTVHSKDSDANGKMEEDHSPGGTVHPKDSDAEASLPSADRPQNDFPTNSSDNVVAVRQETPRSVALPSTSSARKPWRSSSRSRDSSRASSAIGAYTVQCVECLKWRLIPTKKQYEDIRHSAIEDPFVCSKASSWRPNVSCEDPTDLSQDESKFWIIDKPNIPRTPSGWERLLAIRGEGSNKFADVYYLAPTGKKLRSKIEVQKFLEENPQFAEQGVTLSQFNYKIPRPLHQEYLEKRSASDAQIEPKEARTGKRRISIHGRN